MTDKKIRRSTCLSVGGGLNPEKLPYKFISHIDLLASADVMLWSSASPPFVMPMLELSELAKTSSHSVVIVVMTGEIYVFFIIA